ncbi:SET domain, putative [Plasmodium yoelii yoelii]|uniref:SET domain, putative n=1 Tax=Plasmodium yoelii yoelii TaxID=73239 RepID=Q7RPV6_PLAYO|nr:SET domain, putative [Plasmodium yoelii yoelii]
MQPMCGYRNNHIPLLIYDRYYFWSLHFLFEKSKVKRQRLNINTKLGIQDCINKYNIYDELDMYTSIYNSAYNKYENTTDNQFNSYELNKRRNENANKHDSKNGNMFNNDQIKYLYLNGLKNNKNILEDNSNDINDVKWYRLKIKIEEAGKKNKNTDKCNQKKSSNINSFSCLTNENENENLNKLIKMQKKKATFLNQNKVKMEDTENKSQIINNSSCNTQKNEKNGNQEKPIIISDTDNHISINNNAKRKKRKTWYYCHSSSNDMTDDDDEKPDSIVANHEIYIENTNEVNTGVKDGEHNEYFETDKYCRENNFNCSHIGQSQNNIYDANNEIDKLKCRNDGKELDNKNDNDNSSTKLEGMKNHCVNIEDTTIENDTETQKEKNKENLKTKNICIKENNTNKPINLNENTKLILESSKLYKLENYEYVNCFKNMFYNNLEDQQNKINSHIFKKNKLDKDCIDIYINKILKNILDKKKPHLNSLSKSFERIETLYKNNYKIFIIDDEDFYTCDKKEHFKNQNYLYELSDQTIENDVQNFEDNDIFNYFKKYIPTEPNVENFISESQDNYHAFQNERITTENVDIEGKSYSSFKEGIDVKEKLKTEGNVLSKEGITETNHLTQNSIPTEFNKDCNDQKLEDISENTELVTDTDIIFAFISKKHKSLEKKLKQGDYIYIKFNDTGHSYDKVKILPKKIIIQILIYLIKNTENIKLTTISTYSPDLLWNISLHFRKYIIDLDICFEKLYKFFSEKREQENENGGKKEAKQGLADFYDSCISYYGKSQNKKQDIEIMKLKDSVNFIDKFLQNINSRKIEKLKKSRIEYYGKYEYDRTINKLNKQQLIDLFIDKEAEINTIPLSYLKEKSRNIIYEENLKMNMFACIKVIFDSTKGRCIYADTQINKFDFVFEYVGELLTHNEAMEREQIYIKNKKKGCYMFYFKHENKRYCIDGTEESIDAAINYTNKKYFLRSFARLVNHSKKNSNLIPKVLTVDFLPRLFFIASRDIQKGEELLIDYGERNREIIKDNEWLKL